MIFWIFRGPKIKKCKIRDSHVEERSILYLLAFLFAFCFKTEFLANFQTFTTFRPKPACSDVTKINITQKFSDQTASFFDRGCRIDVWEAMQNFTAIAWRVFELSRIISWGAFFAPPPSQWRVNLGRGQGQSEVTRGHQNN